MKPPIEQKLSDDAFTNSTQMTAPFLKWLGGKRWLLPWLEKRLETKRYATYYEPFLGGGSVFFRFKFKPAVLSDINPELINTYKQVRDNPKELIKKLQELDVDSKTFYRLRGSNDTDEINRAVRFIYLNRTAFGGMYRVNSQGQYNVPYGNYKNTSVEIIWKQNLVSSASIALQQVELLCTDFEISLNLAGPDDLVYCDPTYTTMHDNNGFKEYNEPSFTWEDQIRLAKACKRARERGATVIISNACHKEVKELYEWCESSILERHSVLCPRPSKRKAVKEYMFIGIPD